MPAIASTQFEAIENGSQVADGAVGGSDFKGFPPAIASTQFEAIENRSQVADAARWGSDFKGFPPAIASTQFEAIENGSQVERSTAPTCIRTNWNSGVTALCNFFQGAVIFWGDVAPATQARTRDQLGSESIRARGTWFRHPAQGIRRQSRRAASRALEQILTGENLLQHRFPPSVDPVCDLSSPGKSCTLRWVPGRS